MFTRGKTPRQGSHPTAGEAHCCTSTTGRLSLSSLSPSLSPPSHKTQFTASHPAPHPPALAGCTGLMQNKILWKQSSGQGWAAMTVPQHNLFYLTPANASEHTAGHGGAQRTHSSPSFYTWWDQRRLAKDTTIAFSSCLKKLVKVINLVKPKSPIMKTKQ